MENKIVNILGTEYKIIEDESLAKSIADGECRPYEKEIHIRKIDDLLSDDDSIEVKEMRYKEVLMHELWHSLFFESGLEDYCDNEQLVDFLAKQAPKLFKVFRELEIL